MTSHTNPKRPTMSRVRGRSRRRGAALLEFVLIFPMFLFLIAFILDMSRLMLISGAVQDATYRSARAGATVGGGELPDGRTISQDAFDEALDELPGGDAVQASDVVVVRGDVCQLSDPYVEVHVGFTIELLTPGLGRLLDLSAPGGDSGVDIPGSFTMESSAVARCEVAQ